MYAADALRFQPIAGDTIKYLDLFKLGHSPANAQLEYETTLMLKIETPQSLADTSINPKVIDVYNILNVWKKIGCKEWKVYNMKS